MLEAEAAVYYFQIYRLLSTVYGHLNRLLQLPHLRAPRQKLNRVARL